MKKLGLIFALTLVLTGFLSASTDYKIAHDKDGGVQKIAHDKDGFRFHQIAHDKDGFNFCPIGDARDTIA